MKISIVTLLQTQKMEKYISGWNYNRNMNILIGMGMTDDDLLLYIRIFSKKKPKETIAVYTSSHAAPLSIFVCWRAMRMLSKLPEIREEDLDTVLFASEYNNPNLNLHKHKELTISKIGQGEFDSIMSMKIPERVIKLGERLISMRIPLYESVKAEVNAGTIDEERAKQMSSLLDGKENF